jgi:hypothetical protein
MRLVYSALLGITLAACASTGTGTTAAVTTGNEAVADSSVPADSMHLMAAEFANANLPTAYDLVEHFRRPWLRRDPLTGGPVTVYMEQQSLGAADALRQVPTADVASFEFLPHDKATLRYGSTIAGSVIVVMKKY